MISVLIHAKTPEPALTLTLSRLVDGVVEGLVRDAALVDLAGDALAASLADAAGCNLFRPGAAQDPVAAALDSLRGDWVALVPAGLAPERDWSRGVRDFLALSAAGGEIRGGAIFPATPLRAQGAARRIMATLGLVRPRAIVLAQRATLRALPSGPDLQRAAERAVRGSGRAIAIRNAVSDASA